MADITSESAAGFISESVADLPRNQQIIDAILEADGASPSKQRHTAKRIYERLRAEHGFAGGYTTVKDYVRERRQRRREVFVPLAHPSGHAQVDFGEAVAVIGGVRQKIHFFCLDLPHSDAGFVKAYPAERLEAFLDGHNAAFAFLGGVPKSILYDNTKLAVGRILGDGTRQRTRAFAELQSHYLFLDRFGRPGKGNDKGKVEGLVGYVRRNFLVPIPTFASFAELNVHLEQRCLERLDYRVRGHAESIGERLVHDLAALQPRPATPFDACDRRPGRVSSLSLVRYDRNDYSVPTVYGHRPVLVRGYVDEVVIACGAEIMPCWSGRSAPSTKPQRCRAGTCPKHQQPAVRRVDICVRPAPEGRRGTTSLAVRICTASPCWLRVALRKVTMPRSGRDRDGVTASTSNSTVSTSPDRVGRGQAISPPAPTMPPAIGAPPSTKRRMVSAAVCQPLAASPPSRLVRAACSSRWKGCGSNSAAKVLIAASSTITDPLVKRRPTMRSSR